MPDSVINILHDDVINKIAAGEVIERPASIVRELVDNSIDAGATSVEVEVQEGGQALIRVKDNGSGMAAADAELCFKRHATSKISALEDLDQISSLGFRGEALSSIASVAEVSLKTMRQDAEIGTEIRIEHGKIISRRPWAGSQGSEFEVARLFANLPARKKFLKSPRSDLGKIQDWLYASAMAHPSIRYRLLSASSEIIFLQAHRDLFERLGLLLKGTTIRVDYSAGPFKVRGLLAHPAQADFKLNNLVFLVNSRPVYDKLLLRSVRDAWSTGLRLGESPIGALEISLPNSEVDINVHPQKSEVRFRNSQAVFGSLYKAVKLGLSEWMPDSVMRPWQSGSLTVDPIPPAETASENRVSSAQMTFRDPDSNISAINDQFLGLRFLGQILGVFLIFERDSRVFLLDAHAAHERIRFNELTEWARAGDYPAQMLLVPERFELGSAAVAAVIDKSDQLKTLGFSLHDKGSSLEISSYPAAFKFSEIEWFLSLIASSEEDNCLESLRQLLEKGLARSACRGSVMSGQLISSAEALELWRKIQLEPQGAVCPHGRPVMVELTREQLDGMFLRDGFKKSNC